MHTCVRVCVYTHICTRMYEIMHIYIYMCVYITVCIGMCLCVNVCVCVPTKCSNILAHIDITCACAHSQHPDSVSLHVNSWRA